MKFYYIGKCPKCSKGVSLCVRECTHCGETNFIEETGLRAVTKNRCPTCRWSWRLFRTTTTENCTCFEGKKTIPQLLEKRINMKFYPPTKGIKYTEKRVHISECGGGNMKDEKTELELAREVCMLLAQLTLKMYLDTLRVPASDKKKEELARFTHNYSLWKLGELFACSEDELEYMKKDLENRLAA